MQFVSREEYKRSRTKNPFAYVKNKFGDFYLVPEGGTNALAVQGCKEILTDKIVKRLYLLCNWNRRNDIRHNQ
jgi:1-aminocyclopropane-1-carboxylate deaminase